MDLATEEAMIQFNKLKVVFNGGTAIEKRALNGVSLSIKEREFVTVIGGNGAGKTTLLSALCGNVIPSSGTVIIGEVDVTKWPVWRRAGYVARVFQDPIAGTCAHLSIEENLALANKRAQQHTFCRALSKEARGKFIEQLARLGLGLEKRLRDPMGLLSGGQRQAVSLLMCTLQPMKILALDEHTAALDPKTADFVMGLTHQIIAENNLTVLMVTHSMQQALSYGSRTVMLSEGKVVFDVKDAKRKQVTTQDLLDLFHQNHLVGDDMLLS